MNTAKITSVQVAHYFNSGEYIPINLEFNKSKEVELIETNGSSVTIFADTWELIKDQIDAHFAARSEGGEE